MRQQIVKGILSTIVGYGTGNIIGNIIGEHCQSVKGIAKIPILIASFFIGAMVGDKVSNYSCKMVNEWLDAVEEVKNEMTDPEEAVET